ncbi:MAG TPA: acetyl-CoA acetyltransferase, partial [Dehalococcoidia bacterium]|nr:acetyl-CoA acetyltransferase [Dehalococcoidia bacterium]
MPTYDNFPVIVGAAQYVNRSDDLADAREPLEMMALVARAAEADASAEGLLARLDSLQVVGILGWPYPDAPGLLAKRLGARPAHTLYSAVGGETPQRLINETAQAIVEGRVQMALLAGAEALHSLRLARARGHRFDWTPRGSPLSVVGDTRPGFSEDEARHGATVPTRVYPLFENAIRAHLGISVADHQRRLGRLCARFAAVAAGNPYAWFPQARTAEEITAVGPRNRMICFPYPKLMNAIIETDQAAAVILTSVANARRLGIPEDRWVYLWGCGDAVDKWFISERLNYYSSPAISKATRQALGMAGVKPDDVAMFDLYSCFPSAVQLALDALGLDPDDQRPLTVTGGLPYAGGPGNNYVTHSVAATVERLRAEPEALALVTGLGWFATKHSVGVYSGRPPSGPWTRADPAADQALIDAMESPAFSAEADGPAVIETYTVAFDREGRP